MTLESRHSGHSRERLPATSTRSPLEPLLTSKEVAALLQVSASTLCRWREHHDGPPWINLGGIPATAPTTSHAGPKASSKDDYLEDVERPVARAGEVRSTDCRDSDIRPQS